MVGPQPPKVPCNSTLGKRLAKLGTGQNEKYKIINDLFLLPLLADLTNQTGLVHNTYVEEYIIRDNYDGHIKERYIRRVSLYRTRPKTHGFWNWLARGFRPQQECLNITFNEQLWCCRYLISQYYLTAERLKEEYYAKLKEPFGGNDFVIVGHE